MTDNGKPIRFTSPAERERRTVRLREAMTEHGSSALVICGRGDTRFRGRVFYVSDILEVSGDTFVVMPLQGEPIFFASPVVGLARARLTDWITDLRMSATPGTEIGIALAELGSDKDTIGVVGLRDAISVAHLQELNEALPHATILDATDVFEEVRRVKSPEEIANLEETSAAFRKVFAALEAQIRPGITERDLLAEATCVARKHGCLDVKAAISTTPFAAVTYGSLRRISKDDVVMIWIESPGPSGYWLELRRCFSFGPPPSDIYAFWKLQVEAMQAALAAMKPGAAASAVVAAVDAVLAEDGYRCVETDSTYSLHGIGTDAIEGFWYPGIDIAIAENEVLSYHPAVNFPDESRARRLRFIGTTDNVLVTPAGGQRMTYTEDAFVQL